MLGWSQTELGRMAGVSKDTVLDYELNRKGVRRATLTVMEMALVRAGVVFLDIPGRGVGVLVDEGAFAAKPEARRFSTPAAR